MEVALTVRRARLGNREYRVLRPAVPIHSVSLRDDPSWHVLMSTDSGEVLRIAALWRLAALSRRSLVHIPLRLDPRAMAREAHWTGGDQAYDLLLAHHSLQVPPSRWKEIRGALDRGRPHVAEIDIDPHPEPHDWATARHRRQCDQDRLDIKVHANTIIFTGSETALRTGACAFTQLALLGPAAVHKEPATSYYSGSLHRLDERLRHRSDTGLHLLFHDPGWEAAKERGFTPPRPRRRPPSRGVRPRR